MKKIVRLTETDLRRIVKRVLKESVDDEKLNKILDKITEYGMESLTKQELLYLDISSTNVGGKEVLANKNNLIDKIIKSLKKPYFKDLIKTKVPKEYWEDIFSKIFNQKVTIDVWYDKGGALGRLIKDVYYVKDKKGRNIYVENPENNTWTINAFDENKNTMYSENEEGWSKTYGWVDKNGELGKWTFQEHSNGKWSKRDYDKNGNLIYSEASNGNWTKNEYDKNGYLIYSEYSDGTWDKYKYTNNGKDFTRTSSDGKIYKFKGKDIIDLSPNQDEDYDDEDDLEGEDWKRNLSPDDDEYDDDEYDDDVDYDSNGNVINYEDDVDYSDISPKRLKDIPFANWIIKNSEGKYYNSNYGNHRWEDDIYKSSAYPYNEAFYDAFDMGLKDFKIVHIEDERKK